MPEDLENAKELDKASSQDGMGQGCLTLLLGVGILLLGIGMIGWAGVSEIERFNSSFESSRTYRGKVAIAVKLGELMGRTGVNIALITGVALCLVGGIGLLIAKAKS